MLTISRAGRSENAGRGAANGDFRDSGCVYPRGYIEPRRICYRCFSYGYCVGCTYSARVSKKIYGVAQ